MVPRDTGMAIVTKSPTRHLVVGTAVIAMLSQLLQKSLQKKETNRMARGPLAVAPTKITTAASAAKANVQRNNDHVEPREARIEAKDDCKREKCRSYYGRDPCNDSMWE